MPFFTPRKSVWVGILVIVFMWSLPAAFAVETGPVDRKWGLGWDSGLTARLWLGGVWEIGVAAGPNDFLNDGEHHTYNTGQPPNWYEREELTSTDDRNESGFVRFQAGRLLSRRGPLALVLFSGLQYQWTDLRNNSDRIDLDDPDNNYMRVLNFDNSTWTLSLGIRPSFVVLDFLTIETAFGLEYRWFRSDWVERQEYPETGQIWVDVRSNEGNSFDDSGWNGMASLQFLVWF
ncbi:MAG: hypothetical protein KAH56_11335 [Candidatus Krumholzibacteria bacterium]|nr:hypothetical protein [Candidatus Krumholzibacteria bacterium]